MPTFKIGVRELVEFTLRSGDLNAKLNSNNTAQQGVKIHQHLQHQRGRKFKAEYPLKKTFMMGNNALLVHGRADGIVLGPPPLIEEIKTSDVEWAQLPKNILKLYWGQVKVYAALLTLVKPQLKQISLRLTYVQTPEQKITSTDQKITKTTAQSFLRQLLTEYQEWLSLRAHLHQQTVTSAQHLSFPFPHYRPHQKKMAQVVYKTIYTHHHLLLEAPTGTGKTMSTLFPAIKALGEKKLQRCFYLTAKQSTRHVAETALTTLSKAGLVANSITFTAKDQITFAEEADLAPDANPYMIGYYDRIKPALKAALTHHHQFTRAIIEQYARQYQLDPFTFTLDLSEFCSIIICDYNYLFDPTIQLERFFKIASQDKCYLIDEAHNLVDRSREMYSTNFSSEPLAQVIQLIRQHPRNKKRLLRGLTELLDLFNTYRSQLNSRSQISIKPPLKPFNQQVNRLIHILHKWLSNHDETSDLQQQLLQICFTAIKWSRIAELDHDSYYTRIIKTDQQTLIRQFCVDPSKFLKETMNDAGSVILFSATLSPMDYYQSVLDPDPSLLKYRVPSPFPAQNQLIINTTYLNTTYQQRQRSVLPLVKTIYAACQAQAGHYLIFLPSFSYLKLVVQQFQTTFPKIKIIIQHPQMNFNQRTQFIAALQNNCETTLVGFAILGGIFSEGIDLTGRQLIGVGIVSVGLPGLNPETDLVAYYFNQLNHRGFAYAYQLPGWNHVVQAAGRLIRTAHDRGVIILMDQRFQQFRYQSLFPNNWQHQIKASSPQQVQTVIHQFSMASTKNDG